MIVTNIIKVFSATPFCKSLEKNLKSMGWPLFLKFVWQRKCSILFFTLMFMLVVPAILTRNKRRCSRFWNSVSLVCWS